MTPAADLPGRLPSSRRRLWLRWILRATGEGDYVRRAHDALVDLGAAAHSHLARRAIGAEINLRCAYRAALFYGERIADPDVRALALHAAHQCARALSPVAVGDTEAAAYAIDDIEEAYDAARQAMVDYLEDIGADL